MVDPDQLLKSAASYLGLHCLHRPACPNTNGKYGIASGDPDKVISIVTI